MVLIMITIQFIQSDHHRNALLQQVDPGRHPHLAPMKLIILLLEYLKEFYPRVLHTKDFPNLFRQSQQILHPTWTQEEALGFAQW